MKQFFTVLGCLLFLINGYAQELNMTKLKPLPYYEIPDYPEDFSSGNVAARVIDGLGYRYYWATEGLRPEDLEYKPSEDGRTIRETMDHIYRLTRTIAYTTKNIPIIRLKEEAIEFDELRKKTLLHIHDASVQLKGKSAEDLDDLAIVFKREDKTSEYPFWNLLNGPIADAIYHTGQIVAFRRAAGNPIDFRVSQFMGKNRE